MWDDKHFRLPAKDLVEGVRDARERTLALVSDLDGAELEVPERATLNPPLWELGHIAFFFEVFFSRLLGRRQPILRTEPGRPTADALYDSFHVAHDIRWSLPLPSRAETLGYMEDVLEDVVARLEAKEPGPTETYLALLGTLHEDMHGEALTYTRQALEYPPPQLPYAERPVAGPLPGDVEVPGGTFVLGASEDDPFVFDNEKWAHPVEVPPFRIARAPVTNEEFAAFVDQGGYRKRELWSAEGWAVRSRTGARHPLYWHRGEDGWLRRHFDRFVPLEPHAPVAHVSWYEAEAYCNWAGRRLPTEAEWEMAASAERDPAAGAKRRYPWGEEPPSPERANLDSRYGGPVDVAAFPDADSPFGCRQMIGNVWEWTASAFYPYPGYVVDHPYREYSAPWFGYHKVLRGGAWATRSRLVRNVYRNFFLPDRADIFAGFRTCAR